MKITHWLKSLAATPVYTWSKPGLANFGDELNTVLIPALTGRPCFRVPQGYRYNHVAAIGSVLHLVGPGATVWGSGAISSDCTIGRPLRVCAVRGPRTRERLVDLGIPCPTVFGDPALLTPLVYSPRTTVPRSELGIVPHYVDYDHVRRTCPNARVIDVRLPPLAVIDEIAACDHIVSSSLHGIVLAEAYGTKARWASFSAGVTGGTFKFLDFYESVGIQGATPLDLSTTITSQRDLVDQVLQDWQPPSLDVAPLLRAAPFGLRPEVRVRAFGTLQLCDLSVR